MRRGGSSRVEKGLVHVTKRRRGHVDAVPLQEETVLPEAEPPLDRREWLGLAAVTLLAMVLRAVMLGRAELWMDEMCFIIYNVGIDTNPVGAFLRHWDSIVGIGHMPLAGTLQNVWYAVLGMVGFSDVAHSPLLNRLPMVVVGSLAVPGVYVAARTLFGRGPTAWCAAILMACSFYPVYYSREAYCYAYVLFFGAWGLAAWARSYRHGGAWNLAVATLAFTGMALSHLGAVVMVAGAAAVAGSFWFVATWRRFVMPRARNLFHAMLAPLLAFLVASPFLLKFMLMNTAHIGSGHAPSLWIIWNDAVNKMFLGEKPVLAALAWAVWFVGVAALFAVGRRDRSSAGPMVAATLILGLILLGIATSRTQYSSARYFSPLAPATYVVFGAGLAGIGGLWASRSPWSRAGDGRFAAFGLVACCVVSHVAFFLPLYWVIQNKHEPFARAAEWMNGNLPPGTPYVLQSAYHHRWLGQFHPLPSLVPLTPYVHAGSESEDVVRPRQVALLDRIPQAAVVLMGGQAGDSAEPPWEWPKSRYRNRVCIGSQELRRLMRTGIFPGVPNEQVQDWDYDIYVFFDRWADQLERAREDGAGVVFDFPEWAYQGQQVSPQETLYFRLPKDARRAFTIDNVNDHEVAGRVVVDFLVVGPGGRSSDVSLACDDSTVSAPGVEHGKLSRLSLDVPALQSGTSEISFSLPNAGGGPLTVALWDVRWEATAGRGETEATVESSPPDRAP